MTNSNSKRAAGACLLALSEFCKIYDLPIGALQASVERGHWTAVNGLVERGGRRFMDPAVFKARYGMGSAARV